MSSIGGKYIGIPCGGEKMPMFAKKGNDIDEAQKEAYRKEGDKRTVERIRSEIGRLPIYCAEHKLPFSERTFFSAFTCSDVYKVLTPEDN